MSAGSAELRANYARTLSERCRRRLQMRMDSCDRAPHLRRRIAGPPLTILATSPPRRLERTSPRRPATGRDSVSLSSSPSRTVKPSAPSSPPPRPSSSVPSRVSFHSCSPSPPPYPLLPLISADAWFATEPPRDRKKEKNIRHTGNVSLDEIIDIARIMRPKSLGRELSGTVREMLGTCQSLGCTVDGRPAHDMIDAIKAGEIEVPSE